ncbi:MAG: BON domain-containing protein [Candidatus Dormibacteraeota bacterium]|nr:BON domain-containing protein [Candidatus Dormibacteraeota bacterium]
MKTAFSTGELALDQLIRGLTSLRNSLERRIQDVDVDELRDRGSKYAKEARKQRERYSKLARKQGARYADQGGRYADSLLASVEERLRPQPRRRGLPIAGGLLLIGLGAAIAYLAYDRGRREALAGQANRLQQTARQRYAELGGIGGVVEKVQTGGIGGVVDKVQKVRGNGGAGSVGLGEAELEEKVRAVVGDSPQGLRVAVEGRTVYLRGAVADASAADAAAERAHAIEGVVAVVNLTTASSPLGNA